MFSAASGLLYVDDLRDGIDLCDEREELSERLSQLESQVSILNSELYEMKQKHSNLTSELENVIVKHLKSQPLSKQQNTKATAKNNSNLNNRPKTNAYLAFSNITQHNFLGGKFSKPGSQVVTQYSIVEEGKPSKKPIAFTAKVLSVSQCAPKTFYTVLKNSSFTLNRVAQVQLNLSENQARQIQCWVLSDGTDGLVLGNPFLSYEGTWLMSQDGRRVWINGKLWKFVEDDKKTFEGEARLMSVLDKPL